MIDSLSITNFQSIKEAELPLGKFTVLVGKSSSGKSAVLRAIVALASNERGAKSITLGTSSYSISARVGDATVTLEKGKQTSYYIKRGENQTERYDALNGAVPEEVTAILAIAPLTDNKNVNVADQYDPPFLLRATPGEVAKTLGELTGINKIFNAVGEANKRKRASNAVLKIRQEDLSTATQRLGTFEDLDAKISLLKEVDQIYQALQENAFELNQLQQLVENLEIKENYLDKIRDVRKPPSLDSLLAAHASLMSYQSILRELAQKKKELSTAQDQVGNIKERLESSKDELNTAMKTLEYCPTCDRRYNG